MVREVSGVSGRVWRRWGLCAIAVVLVGVSASTLALVPVATVLLAPAMRAMLARATEAAVAQVGAAGIRATLPRVIPIAGYGLPVVVARTMSPGAVGGAVLAVGGVAAAVPWLDTVDCRFQAFGLECDPGSPQQLVSQFCAEFWGITRCSLTASVAANLALQAANASPQANTVIIPGVQTRVIVNTLGVQAPINTFCVNQSITFVGGAGAGTTNYVCSGNVVANPRQELACPPTSPGPSFDGRCKTGAFAATSAAAVSARMSGSAPAPAVQVEAAMQTVEKGYAPTEEEAPQTIQGPASFDMPETVRTTTAPDGTVTHVREQTRVFVRYESTRIIHNEQITRTTTTTAPGGAPQVTVEVIGQPGPAPVPGPGQLPPAPQERQITCGLPDTPACKINETGTPAAVAATALDPAGDPIADLRSIVANPVVAPVAFTWSFQLPSSCGPIPVPGFAQHVDPIDICAYQPIIHDLMSLCWLLAGVIGSWGMLSRAMQ